MLLNENKSELGEFQKSENDENCLSRWFTYLSEGFVLFQEIAKLGLCYNEEYYTRKKYKND